MLLKSALEDVPTGHADGCKFSNRWKLAGAFAQ